MLDIKAVIKGECLVLALPKKAFTGCLEGFRELGAKVWIPDANTIEISEITIQIIIDHSNDYIEVSQ